jgi:hypothetical protein
MGGAGLERLFMTGVSPMVMSDVTSGMNIAASLTLAPELNSLCGFTDQEVGTLLDRIHHERSADAPTWTVESKLDYLAQIASGQDAVIDMIRKDEPLEVTQLRDHFHLRDLLELSAQDASFLGAYLYYFGMVTLAGKTARRTWLLETPNEVVRGQLHHLLRTRLQFPPSVPPRGR